MLLWIVCITVSLCLYDLCMCVWTYLRGQAEAVGRAAFLAVSCAAIGCAASRVPPSSSLRCWFGCFRCQTTRRKVWSINTQHQNIHSSLHREMHGNRIFSHLHTQNKRENDITCHCMLMFIASWFSVDKSSQKRSRSQSFVQGGLMHKNAKVTK